MSFDPHHWEEVYSQSPLKALPWNAGGPDADLVRLVTDGTVPVGQALDIGTGPGHDAVYLIQHGFNVIGIDISPTAVVIARENASNAGLFGFFQQGDIRDIPVESRFIDFAYDRGCFHVLDPQDRPKAIEEVHRVLRKGGLYMLKVFSEKEPSPALSTTALSLQGEGWGEGEAPHRFTRSELETLFSDKFRIQNFWESEFAGPRKPKAYAMLMEKK